MMKKENNIRSNARKTWWKNLSESDRRKHCNKIGRKKTGKNMTCQYCKNAFYVNKANLKITKFCSRHCFFEYCKTYNIGIYNADVKRIAALNSQITLKKRGIGIYSKEVQSDGGIAANRVHKKNNTFCYDKNLMKEIQKTLKKKHVSAFYDPKLRKEIAKKGLEVQRKNKIGPFFNTELNRLQRLNRTRNRKTYSFKSLRFDSQGELEFAMNIHYQIEKLQEGKNFQFNVNGKLIDFFIKSYNCFIEYHPYDREGLDTYYNNRKEILDENGYKNYKLVVIE